MKKTAFVFLLLQAWSMGFGQNQQQIDSLKHELLVTRQDTDKVKVFWNLSEVFSDTDSSLFYAREGLELSRKIKYVGGEARGLLKMAWIYSRKSDPISQSEYVRKAIEIFKKMGNERGIMRALTLYADHYYWQNDFRNELDVCHLPAMKIARKLRDTSGMALILGNIGKTYMTLGHLDSAEISLTEGYQLMEQRLASMDKNDPTYVFAQNDAAYVFLQLGSLKRRKNEIEEALVYLRQALVLSIESKDEQQAAWVYEEFSKTYWEANQMDSALHYANQSLSIAEGVHDSLELRAESGEQLSWIYERMGDYKEALRFKKIALSAKEKLYNDDKTKKLSNLTYREKKRELELAVTKTAYKNQLRLYALLTGMGILLLIAFLLYRNNRQKQKANAILKKQKEKVESANLALQAAHREAQIEAALERVRSRTLMMKESKELNEAVAVFFQQFQILNLLPTEARTYFCHINPTTAIAEVWMTHADGTVMETSHQTPLRNSPSMLNYFEAWQRKEPIVVRSYSGEALSQYLQFVASLPHAKADKDYQKLFSLPPEQIVMTYANFLQGNIGIMTFQPLSREASDILIRFARVFEFTYTRFLDLKKAEAQLREAQIEAALERVRSRTMAMHQSNDLLNVITVVGIELHQIGIPFDWVNILTDVVRKEGFTAWQTVLGLQEPLKVYIPYLDHVVFNAIEESSTNSAEFWSHSLDENELKLWFEHVFSKTSFKNLPDELKQKRLNAKSCDISVVALKNKVFLSLAIHDGAPYPEEQKNIIKRFGKVFEQAYTRFLDLQKAEALAELARLDLIKIQAEKKRAEDALTELRNTQSQLIQSEKLASLGELTAGIAHEIQNPLNFVNNFSELSVDLANELKDEIIKPEKDWELIEDLTNDLTQNQQKINHHGKRAAAIVTGMLQHARTSTGKKEPTDLNALADEYLRLSYHGLRAKDSSFNAKMHTDFDPSIGKVEVIPQDIGRVFLNLLNNAFYATQQRKAANVGGVLNPADVGKYEPTVSVTSKRTSNGVEFRIQDNGTGIPENVKAKIFQPFFTTKPTGQGTGLGLSLAYDIVTKGHGGTLEVTTKENEGTEFILHLPA